MTKDLEQDRVHANDRCTKLETKVHTETAKMEQKLSGAIVQTDSQLESLNDTVGRHHEHFSNLCSKLDAKYQEENDAISDRIQDVEDHFMVRITQVYTRMSKELKEKNEAQDERMEGDYPVRGRPVHGHVHSTRSSMAQTPRPTTSWTPSAAASRRTTRRRSPSATRRSTATSCTSVTSARTWT